MKKIIAPWLLAYVSLVGLTHMQADEKILSNSVFAIPIWIATALFFRALAPKLNRRLVIVSAAGGIFFSACMIFGANIFAKDSMLINHLSTWLKIFAGAIFFAAVISWLLLNVSRANEFFSAKSLRRFDESIGERKYFLVAWCLIFVAWLPTLFAAWPGIFGYDSPLQVAFYANGAVEIVHPPLHTWLLGFCTVTLGKIFGSYERGLLVYSLLQMLCLSATFAAIQLFMFRRKLSGALRAAWQIYFMFFPLNPLMAISATKDIFYSIFFALFVLFATIEFDGNERRTSTTIFLVVAGFLSMLFRSQGVYVFLLGAAISFLLLRNQRVHFGKIFVACLALYAIYSGVLFGLFEVKHSKIYSLREFLGSAVVQMSRVAVYRADELTQEELQSIQNYIPDFRAYESKTAQGSSDPVKGSFRADLVAENPQKFFELWLTLGKRYPTDYVDAFGRLTVGEWYPDLNFRRYYDWQPYFQYKSFKLSADGKEIIFVNGLSPDDEVAFVEAEYFPILIQNSPLKGFAWLDKLYGKLTYEFAYEKIPVVSMLLSTGFILWLIVLYCLWCVYRQRYRLFAAAMFPLALWLSMVMGPVELYRYTFSLAMTIPIFFAMILTDEA